MPGYELRQQDREINSTFLPPRQHGDYNLRRNGNQHLPWPHQNGEPCHLRSQLVHESTLSLSDCENSSLLVWVYYFGTPRLPFKSQPVFYKEQISMNPRYLS